MAATKPENAFIRSIHRLIPDVYGEKMSNPWRSGTADVWYSGLLGDLWVEYKYEAKLPRSHANRPGVTPLQELWLNQRYDEGRNVAVVLGLPNGGVIFRDKEWMEPLTAEQLAAKVVSKAAIAQWIHDQVGVSPCCISRLRSSKPRK